MIAVAMLSLFLMWVSSKRKNHVYLLDYACVKYPDDQAKITSEVVSYFLPGIILMKAILEKYGCIIIFVLSIIKDGLRSVGLGFECVKVSGLL